MCSVFVIFVGVSVVVCRELLCVWVGLAWWFEGASWILVCLWFVGLLVLLVGLVVLGGVLIECRLLRLFGGRCFSVAVSRVFCFFL